MDRSSKFLLTLIAMALWGILLRPVSPTPAAHADGNDTKLAATAVWNPNSGQSERFCFVHFNGSLYVYELDARRKLAKVADMLAP